MERLGPPMEDPLRHLYVHVPYCHKICPYCSFHKHLPGDDLAGFAPALLAEARILAAQPIPRTLQTVYFGGGTPTLLSTGILSDLLPRLAEILDFSAVTEWTMEVNPRTISPKKAAVMLKAGVTRVSLGVQAWDGPTLATLGRDHSPEEARQAFSILREAGFPTVNIDLMFSVPGQSAAAWEDTLGETIALAPDHVSAYNLTYEEDTEFFERCRSGQFSIEEERDEEGFATAMDQLGAAGFDHYEISNYARPGKESRHNQSYWHGADYAGLGPGAVSTIHGHRHKNIENTKLWQAAAMAGSPLHTSLEVITPAKWFCERLALGLRTRQGLPMEWLRDIPDEHLERLVSEGLAAISHDRMRLTHKGKFVADGVAAFLWEACPD